MDEKHRERTVNLETKLVVQPRQVLICPASAFDAQEVDALSSLNRGQVNLVASLTELESKLQTSHYDVVVLAVDDGLDAAMACLHRVTQISPDTVRLLLASEVPVAYAPRISDLAHSCLPRCPSAEQLSFAVDKAFKVSRLVRKQTIKAFVGSIERLPSQPAVCQELNAALVDGTINAQGIAAIVERDPVMAAKILQLVNSAFFGLERQVHRLSEAVTFLGVRLIRDLALSAHLFEAFPQSREWSSFSFEKIHQRSMQVARFAQEICRSVQTSKIVQEQAFLGGLLHDFGMVLLASKDPHKYREVLFRAAELEQPLYVVEKMEFGVSHAEAGAYLLGLWNLPPAVVEGVLFHHFPSSSLSSAFQPLTAIHLADALLAPVETATGRSVSSHISLKYLKKIGYEGRLKQWELMAQSYHDSHSYSEIARF